MRIVVCPSAAAPEVAAEIGATHVLSLTAPGAAAPLLPNSVRHLVLAFNDIAAPHENLVAPDAAAIRSILAFGRTCGASNILLVHCLAGISRSTAAAFVLACQREPQASEAAVARALRRAACYATPNPLIVALADAVLDRQGRMIEAALAIGRGADYAPYRCFELPHLREAVAPPA